MEKIEKRFEEINSVENIEKFIYEKKIIEKETLKFTKPDFIFILKEIKGI
jgi:hypothetical protein